MPTPYGPRGGMAFGAQELRVLRRALALALNPSPVSAQEAQDCLHLADSLDEAMREGARLRAFLLADLARYRAALPGTATGYLALLDEALGAGHRPDADDLAALGALRGTPAAAALLARCAPETPTAPTAPTVTLPAARTRLHAVPGGRQSGKEPPQKPAAKPSPRPAPAPAPATPKRPVPTPGEVFPPRKPAPPAPPAPDSRHHLAAG
ncbi:MULTISPECIES: hypothetical protein [Streptomyces]|uniref:Uncharacterized protein n=3 Tax=Streptomyces violaceoruber group TaxID=2867121 RepID=A0ACD4WQQ6_STRVN|nr:MULTISPECIES: hypothetical protein [unclassified Streptomyces]MDX3347683.1 hypothetical protein [Streptomyces sp. ME02-6979A]WOY99844.1 hypothetical protein R2E43_21270 [Streptomyces violaceoruber]WTE20207.1 hypothetical protein OH747_22310 [Streptomyces anthocyanicus]BDD72935.1 hypothetical protein JCM4020_35550 [Streptomyces coelicolor]